MAQAQEPAGHALELSEQEKVRYQCMAQMAMQHEGDLMRGAGIVPGARIVDMGCGPGAVLVELARIAGEGGEVVGVCCTKARERAFADPLARLFMPQSVAVGRRRE